jgi:hypothetical protein
MWSISGLLHGDVGQALLLGEIIKRFLMGV